MGEDKGLLVYHRAPQVVWVAELLAGLCEGVHVSVNPEQLRVPAYAALSTLVDRQPDQGPAGGLLSAWEAMPGTAWLAVAVDLPFLCRGTLETLLDGRAPGGLATAFRHPGGVLEPVCTLWEPRARSVLADRLRAGDGSLRRVLEAGPTAEVSLPVPGALLSVNTPGEYQKAVAKIAGRAAR